MCTCAAFECLADRRNRDAGNRFARFCSGDALQPQRDAGTDSGFTLTCSANCAAAIGDVRARGTLSHALPVDTSATGDGSKAPRCAARAGVLARV